MAETPLDKNNKRLNCLKYNLQHCNRQNIKVNKNHSTNFDTANKKNLKKVLTK